MSPTRADIEAFARGFPRVSGDEPDATVRKWTQRWFSPRERG